MASVTKYYCDRCSCKKEIQKNELVPIKINMKRSAKYPEIGEREIDIRVDLCQECAETLKNYLSKFFNEGSAMYKYEGGEIIDTSWKACPHHDF